MHAGKWLESAIYKNCLKAWEKKKKGGKTLDMHSQHIVKVCIDPLLTATGKILLRFSLNYNGINPNCSKEEKEQDVLLSIKCFAVEVVHQVIRRVDNRKLWRVRIFTRFAMICVHFSWCYMLLYAMVYRR